MLARLKTRYYVEGGEMANDLETFRNGVLSIYQSAIEDLANRVAGRQFTAGDRPGMENEIIAAGVAAAASRMPKTTGPQPRTDAVSGKIKDCAELGLQYLEARARGDATAAMQIQDEIQFSECDPNWARTLEEYAKYFGPGGGLQPIPYIRAGKIGKQILEMKPNARVALIADWGTGTDAAVSLLQSIKRKSPDIVIHLGDVYYSGTEAECEKFFLQIVNEVFDRANTNVPIFTIPGNHDMYAAGSGFYGLIDKLNGGAQRQPASFFCLRATDANWQFLAMDTGLHDHDPFHVKEVLTYLETDEEDWHVERIREFSGRTILLSHHQLFSAFSQIGQPDQDGKLHPCNPNLLSSYARFQEAASGRIAAWFWGHEHNLCIYQPYAGLECGRCIGHAAIPVFAGDGPYDVPDNLQDPPQLVDKTKLAVSNGVYKHGYAMIEFDGALATVGYFQEKDDKPFYAETISTTT
jgi:Calcineurin-like phosphoesterase